MTSMLCVNKHLITQVHIPFSMTYTYHIERWFKSSEHTFSRLFVDNSSKKYFANASVIKSIYPNAYTFSTISNPYYRTFLCFKKYKKNVDSNINLNTFVKLLDTEVLIKNCADYIDSEVDCVIKNENFEKDFNLMIEKMKLPPRPVKLKYYEPLDAKVFFNSESVKTIKKLFDKDFNTYYNKITER